MDTRGGVGVMVLWCYGVWAILLGCKKRYLT